MIHTFLNFNKTVTEEMHMVDVYTNSVNEQTPNVVSATAELFLTLGDEGAQKAATVSEAVWPGRLYVGYVKVRFLEFKISVKRSRVQDLSHDHVFHFFLRGIVDFNCYQLASVLPVSVCSIDAQNDCRASKLAG